MLKSRLYLLFQFLACKEEEIIVIYSPPNPNALPSVFDIILITLACKEHSFAKSERFEKKKNKQKQKHKHKLTVIF